MYNFSQTEHLEVPRQRPVPMPRTPKVQSSLAGVQFSLVVYGIILKYDLHNDCLKFGHVRVTPDQFN